MFGSKHKEAANPMLEKDRPESDTSDFLHKLGNKKYQPLIGALQ
jgi:hypothetical protein